jgi:peptidoglycan/LPS O-acetylase OafA/YrhL
MLYISIFVLVFNNILLDLYNFKIKTMKKSYLAIIISTLVLAPTIIWLISTKTSLAFPGITQFGIILVLIGFGVFVGLTRLKSDKRGEPAEDELSKKILQKASSVSYYISLYLWLGIMYYSDKTTIETHTLIGAGILGMAVIFFISWLFYKIRGMKDA